MPRLVIHIGYPKTATSSIQDFLHNNRDALIERGVLYPKAGIQGTAHHPIAKFYFRTGLGHPWIWVENKETVLKSLKEEVLLHSPECVLLSSEAFVFVFRHEELVKDFKDFDSITIIAFLRRQDLWYESSYNQHIKGRVSIISAEKYLLFLRDSNQFDYESNLHKWEKAGIDSVVVIPFEKDIFDGKPTLHFLDKIMPGLSADFEEPEKINASISSDFIDLLNTKLLFKIGGRNREKLISYLEFISRFSSEEDKEKKYLSSRQREDLLADYEPSNSKIIGKKYFTGRDVLFDNSDVFKRKSFVQHKPNLVRAIYKLFFYSLKAIFSGLMKGK